VVLPAAHSVSEMAAAEDQLRLVLEDSEVGWCFTLSSERTRLDLNAGSKLASILTVFPFGPTSELGTGLNESVSGSSVPSERRAVRPDTRKPPAPESCPLMCEMDLEVISKLLPVRLEGEFSNSESECPVSCVISRVFGLASFLCGVSCHRRRATEEREPWGRLDGAVDAANPGNRFQLAPCPTPLRLLSGPSRKLRRLRFAYSRKRAYNKWYIHV
jgi:hypothetical protein